MEKGQPLCQGYATENGELALGRNLVVAYMPWQGYNFEDAIVISERVVQDDIYTSIHVEEFELEVRDTKRGEEELTSEIPNVSEETVNTWMKWYHPSVPKCAKAISSSVRSLQRRNRSDPEEKLLRAIFGDKAGDVKDASMKAPPSLKAWSSKQTILRPKRDKDVPKSKKNSMR